MIDVREATIPELQEEMDRGRLTARELALHYLSRIALVDHCDGGLNAVLEVNPDALFIADALDAERHAGRVRGPLHGIPVMLKDTINTADKMHTSAGSLALADNLAPYDAHVVTRLRDAGALILGKANMTELANFMGENMPPGYSSRGGQVRSPFNPGCSPSGSSTGSAVAVAADLCKAALGTENFGSINYPAQANGIVGVKPTMGLVSRHGNIPTTNTLDIIGPMAGSVLDAAIVLSAIAGADARDPATLAFSGPAADYAALLVDPSPAPDALRNVRIGLHGKDRDGLAGGHGAAFERLLCILAQLGATVVETERPGEIISESDIDPVFFHECRSSMNAYLATLRPDLTCTSLKQIIDYNTRHADRALKYGQPLLLRAESGTTGSLTEPEYLRSILKREAAIHRLDAAFSEGRLDVILSPHCEIVAPITGFPSMSLPIGTDQSGMPMGSYWIARRYDEATMLRTAYLTERALGIRCRPEMALSP